jgi:hypothetical protein
LIGSKIIKAVQIGLSGFSSQFRLGKVGFDAFQQKVITRRIGVGRYQLSGAKSLLEMVEFDMHRAVCKSQQLIPLARGFGFQKPFGRR